MKTKLTAEQTRRVISSRAETVRLLAKEAGYMPHLRNAKTIEFLNGHLAHLDEMRMNGFDLAKV